MTTIERLWCWTCGEQRDQTNQYTHRADNPVLAHPRCAVCNDVLMTGPQPTLDQKLAQLGKHLGDAYLCSVTVATEAPNTEQEAALAQITELLTQARQVYFRQLDA